MTGVTTRRISRLRGDRQGDRGDRPIPSSYSGHPLSPPRSHPPTAFPLAVTPVSPVPPWKRAGAKKTGTSLKCGKLGVDPCGPSERAARRASKCVGWCCQRSAAATGSVAIGLDLSQGGERHAEMLGNLGGLHAGQERRSDRIALCGGISRSPRSARPLDRFGSLMPSLSDRELACS